MAPLKRPATSTCMAVISSNGSRISSSVVDQARQLKLPSRDEMLRRDPSVHHFWAQNVKLLEKAWQEWPEPTEEGQTLPVLDHSLFHLKLRQAIEASWKDPTNEHCVRDLWQEESPGVYKCQFFDPEKLKVIRAYLDKAAEAEIPSYSPAVWNCAQSQWFHVG